MRMLPKSDETQASVEEYVAGADPANLASPFALGNYGTSYGFTTSADGIGYTTFNVVSALTKQESDGLGLTSVMGATGNVTIIDTPQSTDPPTIHGLLSVYLTPVFEDGDGSISSFDLRLRTLAKGLYSALNEGSDI